MYKGKSALCIIPARGGSKGLPGKNIKKLANKPLIAYTVEHAKNSKYIDRTIVSTDDEAIASIAKKYKAEVPFLRPKRLATDRARSLDALLHAVQWIEKNEKRFYDILVLLHVTAPLRESKDIDTCIKMLVEKRADNVFSVTEAHRNPYFNMVEVDKMGRPKLVKKGNFSNRQTATVVYDMNASIYVWKMDAFKNMRSTFMQKTYVYVMPKERSVDIDDYFDFKIAGMFVNIKNQ